MTWVRLDDQFFAHRKVVNLSKDAKLLHLAALTHCGAQLTDGRVTPGDLRIICALVSVRQSVVKELTKSGLWDVQNNGDFCLHDYLDYQQSAERAKADRLATAQRQATFRERKREARNGESNAPSNGVTNGVTEGVSNAVSNGSHLHLHLQRSRRGSPKESDHIQGDQTVVADTRADAKATGEVATKRQDNGDDGDDDSNLNPPVVLPKVAKNGHATGRHPPSARDPTATSPPAKDGKAERDTQLEALCADVVRVTGMRGHRPDLLLTCVAAVRDHPPPVILADCAAAASWLEAHGQTMTVERLANWFRRTKWHEYGPAQEESGNEHLQGPHPPHGRRARGGTGTVAATRTDALNLGSYADWFES